MLTDKKVIYSKRFTPPQEFICQEALADDIPVPPGLLPASFDELLQRLEGSVTVSPVPGCEEKSTAFIALAKELSQDYEIDVDISRDDSSVDVCLRLYFISYPKEMTPLLARLFQLCDQVSATSSPGEPTDFALFLSLYTRNYYRNGGLLNY